jgi:SAM-dependent methyltransferase
MQMIRFPFVCGLAATCYLVARLYDAPAIDVDRFGRLLGWQAGFFRGGAAVSLTLQPLESVRYAEFAFALRHLPPRLGRCLDVSSPRLLSLFLAATRDCVVTIVNPDPEDLHVTRTLARVVRRLNLDLHDWNISNLLAPELAAAFDTVWSISVVEHIAGLMDDSDAMAAMWHTVAPGGTLLVTVPVDRRFRLEHCSFPQYPTQPREPDGTFFFQRFYDAHAVHERLVAAVGVAPAAIRWFGERTAGGWNRYRAACDGYGVVPHVTDPLWMMSNFREYSQWSDMPGMGIAGLVFTKPC